MKKNIYFLLILAFVASLVACQKEEEKEITKTTEGNEAQGEALSYNISLKLEQNQFSYENWKMDSSHHKLVKGKLLVDDKPIAGAEIQMSNKRKTTTDPNGEFSVMVDANIIEKDIIHVSSLDYATLEGQAIPDALKKDLLALEEELVVYYPIEVDKTEEVAGDPSKVKVYAHASLHEDEEFPKFGVEKFPIIGTVKDADGNAVQGATVNLRRDGVEGFTMSNPTNENGEYSMYYIPEDDENHYLNVYLPSQHVTYTLPQGKGFLFPDDFGITLDIVLPKEGTIIRDEPPTLVATNAEGALYKGVLIGLNTTEDYTITVPDREGSFVLTVPKDVWETNPSFYQINYRGFSKEPLDLGDTLTSDFLPLPEKDEPDNIVVKK
ncbi:Ig-like domain-containing protein [Bacillaceae bacterium CLA-AA-H227]|uniref:Ig-like domain-containing protein n=1 Tax=Robertmurraya yapensis (ex Hitch et al 2024) TaxID=3133160 RepID=A0ACC6SD84_9BACI